MHLFFDTETTGIPRNYKAPVTDLENWPRLVQLAWLLADADGNEVEYAEHIVKPDGFVIPPAATKIHGITTAHAAQAGADLRVVLNAFVNCLTRATELIAHNMRFDEQILGAEFLRAGQRNLLPATTRRCTMLASTEYCRIPGPYGYKWPSLAELHGKLFHEPLAGAHRALADVRACARCYFELKRRGVIA